MKPFNVLDSTCPIFQSYILEASAGTGKTFAIENLVLRFLIETEGNREPLRLEQILIVTFTKAATHDLRQRIRKNIENALHNFKHLYINPEADLSLPDYLQTVVRQGTEALFLAKRRLERALFCFDEAQIFTIHSFCSQMLRRYSFEAGINFDPSQEREEVSDAYLIKILRDYLRTGLKEEIFSQAQLKIVLNEHQQNVDRLLRALLKHASKQIDINSAPPFYLLLEKFQKLMSTLKQELGLTSAKILSDFFRLAPSYNKLADKSKQIHSHILNKIHKFAAIFDQTEWSAQDFNGCISHGLLMLDVFDPAFRKKNLKEEPLLPDYFEVFKTDLAPLIKQARSYFAIFARMLIDCQHLLKNRLEADGAYRFDDLLTSMETAIQSPKFFDAVQSRYQVAIIDEFQDTDPLQWKIFGLLFSKECWKGWLYLVGDPKQSIYAFRQADIYTYLSASQTLGKECHGTLDTNYRSKPTLIEALNFLFSSTPNFIYLPLANHQIPYRPVHAGVKEHDTHNSPPLTFFCAETKNRSSIEELEETVFFPYITNEIGHLVKKGLKLSQCAVLIFDHSQAARLSNFFERQGVAYTTQKSALLSDSSAIDELRLLLKGILHPRQESAFRSALGTRTIGWDHLAIRQLEDGEQAEKWLHQFQTLQAILLEEGVARLFEELMEMKWGKDTTASEKLLSQKGGAEFYLELSQIVQILALRQSKEQKNPEGLLAYLDDFQSDDGEEIPIQNDRNREAVQILTVHASKGLEFEAVFSLGLMARNRSQDLLVPIREGHQQTWKVVFDEKDPLYKSHCEELDAEKSRQLYVAMTRAKSYLYLPIVTFQEPSIKNWGTASPMELFLARVGQPICSYAELYERIEELKLKDFESLLEAKKSIIRMDKLPSLVPVTPFIGQKQNLQLIPPKPHPIIPAKALFTHSFTSLTKQSAINSSIKEFSPTVSPTEKTPHTLPLGNKTGIILHSIAENLPFQNVRSFECVENLIPHVRPAIEKSELREWEDVICTMFYNVLNAPLDGFSLKEIDSKKIFRETEFLYPAGSFAFLKGVIDMIFEHRGKYYLLDWKSNWLGPSSSDYSQVNMYEAMTSHRYQMQAALYAQGLRSYLKLFDSRPFEELFGGVYYIFMRGVSPCQTEGIFHFFPQNIDVASLC